MVGDVAARAQQARCGGSAAGGPSSSAAQAPVARAAASALRQQQLEQADEVVLVPFAGHVRLAEPDRRRASRCRRKRREVVRWSIAAGGPCPKRRSRPSGKRERRACRGRGCASARSRIATATRSSSGSRAPAGLRRAARLIASRAHRALAGHERRLVVEGDAASARARSACQWIRARHLQRHAAGSEAACAASVAFVSSRRRPWRTAVSGVPPPRRGRGRAPTPPRRAGRTRTGTTGRGRRRARRAGACRARSASAGPCRSSGRRSPKVL